MVDSSIVGFLIFGGLVGALFLSLWPYLRKKQAFEAEIEAIREKPESERTDAEKFKLTIVPESFLQEYKFRFFFGLLVGIGASFAAIQSNLGGLTENTTSWEAFFGGLTASGFFTAIANEIRSS